jgi:nucleotide-binding universal stress UspA family protein
MPAIKHILVPMDFGPASKQALRYACTLADAFGASLHVMHVLHNPYTPGAYMDVYAPLPADYWEKTDREARVALDAQLTAEEKARYAAEFVTVLGTPAYEILEYLKEHPAIDLVVMGTHGRGGVSRLLMGSVADKVVRAAHCPVVTLHPQEEPETRSASQAA